MLIRLLGPIDVVDDDGTVHLSTSAIRRTLVSLFALHAGRVLSVDWLLEHVWNGEVPLSGARALRNHISKLRREMGRAELIETCAGGYRLGLAASDVDAAVVELLGREARMATDHVRAARLCSEALAMWRGEPFIDASPTSDLTDEGCRLDELRLGLTELSYRCRFDAGEGVELVPGLLRLTGDHPEREVLWYLLIAAQYRAGRQAEALRSYDTVRSILVETLGVDPSPELRQLQQRVLKQDPTLSAPPVGQSSAVAMLLWDVKGTEGLLVRRRQAGIDTLARAAELVSIVAHGHGGRVSTSQGEHIGAVVVFESAADAVAAAVEVHERVFKESWADSEQVDVRCAVHVGEVSATPDGVFGVEVHRCAGLRALTDGGEVFLSSAAVNAVGGLLPVDCSVVDEGFVVVRGFADPERVWRLVNPVLRLRRGPVVGAGPLPRELPMWRTSFVGRSVEIASVAARLDAGRLVSLVGPAGVGKTRLAATVAGEMPIRVCFVDLTLATNDDDVDAVVADALGADPDSSPRAGIEDVLGKAPALVVLDNCEHVLDAAASMVEQLLARCEASRVLATSRAPLGLADEDVFVVAPLLTEPGGAAARLFLDRAVSARATLTPNDAELGEITAITDLLDGVPLAIELAAARVTAFSVGEILAQLQHDLAGLGVANRRGPDRHRTIRAAIEWSMRTLSDNERRVLCQLAVLPGSFRLNTASAVSDESRLVVAALPGLVEQSLVTTDHRAGATRYRILEMIRAVAADTLDASSRSAVLDRLLDDCLAQLEQLEGLDAPPAGLETEIARDNALYHCSFEHAVSTDRIDLGLRLVYKLFAAWHSRNQRSTLDRWMKELVVRTDGPSRMRARVLRRQAIIAAEEFQDDAELTRLLDSAEADALAVSDRQVLAEIRATRAAFDLDGGRLEGLETRLREAVAFLEEFGDGFVANTLTSLADLHRFRAEFDRAEEALTRAAAANPTWFQRGHIEVDRAWCALITGRIESASTRAVAALDLAERSGSSDLICHAIEVGAWSALARGETELARQLLVRALSVAAEHELSMRPYALMGLAIVSALMNDVVVARSCRDELSGRDFVTWEMDADRRLACAFVDLVSGAADKAANAATEVAHEATVRGQLYLRVLGLELGAASIASSDPKRARDLITAADQQRAAVGAVAWPLDPYRHVALRELNSLNA